MWTVCTLSTYGPAQEEIRWMALDTRRNIAEVPRSAGTRPFILERLVLLEDVASAFHVSLADSSLIPCELGSWAFINSGRYVRERLEIAPRGVP
jgi:hypothetical protein